MSGFYTWAMRSAAGILFAFALLSVVGTLAYNLMILGDMQSAYSSQPNLRLTQVLMSILVSLQNAALPLFGAAALWRADRWLARSAKGVVE